MPISGMATAFVSITGPRQGLRFTQLLSQENETAVIRWDYGDPAVGTCKETIEGGNHFRYWIQNGAAANRFV